MNPKIVDLITKSVSLILAIERADSPIAKRAAVGDVRAYIRSTYKGIDRTIADDALDAAAGMAASGRTEYGEKDKGQVEAIKSDIVNRYRDAITKSRANPFPMGVFKTDNLYEYIGTAYKGDELACARALLDAATGKDAMPKMWPAIDRGRFEEIKSDIVNRVRDLRLSGNRNG